jgi:hypothetical protein
MRVASTKPKPGLLTVVESWMLALVEFTCAMGCWIVCLCVSIMHQLPPAIQNAQAAYRFHQVSCFKLLGCHPLFVGLLSGEHLHSGYECVEHFWIEQS